MDIALIIFSSQKKEKSNKYLNLILFLVFIYVAYKENYWNSFKNLCKDFYKKYELFSLKN